MLVAIGKTIELDVDVTRFNSEVHDHIVRTGLRNLLMDAHASATAKGDPENYINRSRELAEKKLASLYAGVVRAQSFGGPKAPTDPVAMVILRLARKAVQRDRAKEIAAAPKAEKLATSISLRPLTQRNTTQRFAHGPRKFVALEDRRAASGETCHVTKPAKKRAA